MTTIVTALHKARLHVSIIVLFLLNMDVSICNYCACATTHVIIWTGTYNVIIHYYYMYCA